MARVNTTEIDETIEMFVNSIYDLGEESGWMTATEGEWIDAVYGELVTWKTEDGYSCPSNENRFDGKNSLIRKIETRVRKRLNELESEGYHIG